MDQFKGTGVALITPFNEDLSIDFDSLRKILSFTAEKGIDYYVVMGTTGENPTLSNNEKLQVLNFVKENNPHNLPIMYGIGGNNTQAIIDELKSGRTEGVDAILSVCPYYSKPSQRAIINHFQQIADISTVPVMLYNVPGRTGVNMLSETTLELAKHEQIIGVKEASADLSQCITIAANKPDDFLLLSGDDLLTPAMIAIGCSGVISVMANALPEEFSKMINYSLAFEYEKAKTILYAIRDFNKLLYEESSPVGVKEAMAYLNLCNNTVRPPLFHGSEHLRNAIIKELDKIKKQSY